MYQHEENGIFEGGQIEIRRERSRCKDRSRMCFPLRHEWSGLRMRAEFSPRRDYLHRLYSLLSPQCKGKTTLCCRHVCRNHSPCGRQREHLITIFGIRLKFLYDIKRRNAPCISPLFLFYPSVNHNSSNLFQRYFSPLFLTQSLPIHAMNQ